MKTSLLYPVCKKLFSIQAVAFLFSLILLTLFSACSNSPVKSATQQEAEQFAQQWFDNSFANCNGTFVTKYDDRKIGFGKSYGASMETGFVQFKQLSFDFMEAPLTEADKLNGISIKGLFRLLPNTPNLPTLRYYESNPRYSTPKWSEWMQEGINYRNEGSLFPTDESNLNELTPTVRDVKKIKDKWEGFPKGFTKPQCSEVPAG